VRIIRPGAGGHARGDGDDLAGCGVGAFGAFGEGDAQLAAGVGADESFVDGFAEDHGEQHQDVLAALVAERPPWCARRPPPHTVDLPPARCNHVSCEVLNQY
jgi:hypothetical protein